jgi:chaperonin GroES
MKLIFIKIYKGEFMKFKPLHDRVLIEVLDGSEKTAGGIIIPDTAQEKPQEGKVVAVGGGAKTEDGKIIPMDVKVGDKVLFGKWSGKEYSIMKESDIMGISGK